MKLTLLVSAIMLAGSILAPRASAQGSDVRAFYVAPGGNDAWSGLLAEPNAGGTDGPFRTIVRARDAVRELKAREGTLSAPVTVFLRQGSHFLAAPVVLGPEDSGTESCPVTYAAFEGEKPIITGGVAINGWQQGPNGLWTVELPEVRDGDWYFRQLFVKRPDRDYYERRYRPSRGAFVIAGLTNAPPREGAGHRRSQDEFRFFEGDIENWQNLEDVEIVALHDWSSSRLRIRELDMENHVVKFTAYPVYRIGHWWAEGRNPYYAENVKEALGRPGEWYLDRISGVLSYKPMPGEDMTSLTVVAPRTEQLVKFTGDANLGVCAEYIRLKGLSFMHTHWALPDEGYSSGQGMTGLPSAVAAAGARNLLIEGCTFAHLGAYAAELGSGCEDNQIVGNRMYDLGGGGVKVGGNSSVPRNNLVANNVISDGGLVHFSAHGIWAGITQGTVIRHNVVRRFLYSNISVGWSWNDKPTACRDNIVEYNHIHDAMMLLADGGAIYTLGAQPGTVMRGNHIHDVHRSKYAGSAPNNGFFFDQGSKGFLCERNLIYRTSGQPVRHNQNEAGWHTWTDNYLGVSPEDPDFPQSIVDNAGLEEQYRYLDENPVPVNGTPILSMELPPPPPPGPIVDTFEENAFDNGPQKRQLQGAGGETLVAVTDETAAVGKRSLKFTDSPKAAKPFYPYLQYRTTYPKGRATVSLSLRVDADASVGVELRHIAPGGFITGPVLRADGAGTLSAGAERLMDIPVGEWFGLEFRLGLGDECTGLYDLTVTVPGAEPRVFEGLAVANDAFKQLDWVMVIGHGNKDAAFYLDEVRIKNE